MTPAARVAASIEILNEIGRGDTPADAILADWFRGHRFAGSGDRRAIRDSVYADLRNGALLRWFVSESHGDPEDPRLRSIAGMAREMPEALEVTFSGEGYGPLPLTSEEQELANVVKEKDESGVPDHVRVNCSAELFGIFAAQWCESTLDELAALNRTAPVDFRVNTLNASLADAQARLNADGYETAPLPFSPWGLRSMNRGNFQLLGAYREGIVDVQDESSQLVAILVDAAPGHRVIDYCAGAGGKTLALAAATNNEADILACDISGARLSRGLPRMARLGVTCVRTLQVPAGHPPDDLRGHGDRVLIDAPCSGTGTWRRSPDVRWRTSADTVAACLGVQDGLLDTAASLVRPGGRVIYSVCSVLKSEGIERVEAFLARASGFVRVPVVQVLGRGLAGDLGVTDDLMLTPYRHGTDGMYAAVIERTS
ncbi:MAG: rRNA cytosine-C5-methylase [Alphaproteobacteria bacterium]|nr:rRNA cytosine-C5-methylase [Alphaproteobacteria bacterium]